LAPKFLEQAAFGRAGHHGDLPRGDPFDSPPLDQAQRGVKDALARAGVGMIASCACYEPLDSRVRTPYHSRVRTHYH
jgi:hypothetical protein